MSEAPNSVAPPNAAASSDVQHADINAVWVTARRALLMLGRSLQTLGQSPRHHNAGILGDALIAAAGAIERRLK